MEYVCTGATLKCSMGTATSKLKATPKNVTLTGKDQANIADYVSMTNVPGFGKCRSLAYPPTASATAANHGRLTPMPCIPGTCPKWQAVDKDSLVCGEPALLKPATLKCMYGGTISIVSPGQNKEVKSPSEMGVITGGAAPIDVNTESVLDGIQLALDAAGFAPGVGAIPDLLNAAIYAVSGNYVEAGMSLLAAVPGIGDVAAATKIVYKGTKIAVKTTKVGKSTEAVYTPFLKLTEKKLPKETIASNRPKLGELTINNKLINANSKNIPEIKIDNTPHNIKQELQAKNITINSKYVDEAILRDQDSLKEIFKYKGKIPKSNDKGDIDLSF